MRPRKPIEIVQCLAKKGFELSKTKAHHQFYYLILDGKKHSIYTYVSHGKKEYDKKLMGEVKKQLKFRETDKAEDFFDCPMSGKDYVEMLKEFKEI
jgi:predicted RNA binding protein YcfA (HicA-like mRNA interferase family)